MSRPCLSYRGKIGIIERSLGEFNNSRATGLWFCLTEKAALPSTFHDGGTLGDAAERRRTR